MRKNWRAVLYVGLAIVFVAGLAQVQGRRTRVAQSTSAQSAGSEQAKQITCTGKVVDAQGQPIAGARVSLYQVDYDQATYTSDSNLAGEVATAADGVFSFIVRVESGGYQDGYIVAEKEGLALGFADWRISKDEKFEIELNQAKKLAGVVVDENNEPVPGVSVSVWLLAVGKGEEQRRLGRPVAAELLTSVTDADGRFAFANISAEATADFLIKKTGRATVNTFRSTGYANQRLRFAPGQTDIRLVSPVEARIEGTVVTKDTGKPISGVRLIVKKETNRPLFGQGPVSSKEDGTFNINALAAGNYLVQLVRPQEGGGEWVAEPAKIALEVGQTKTDVRIELSKGGFLEVLITEARTNKPLDKASVSIRDGKNSQWLSARSGKDGIARIRLIPGEYQLSGVYMQGYTSDRHQEAVTTIEQGSTKRVTRTLRESPKVKGVVRDVAGRPIEGVVLKVLPGGREEVSSDSEGKFEIVCDRRGWGEEDTVFCLVARHEQRNLAAAVEIDEKTKTLDIKLAPGVTFASKVVDLDNKGIADAKVRVMLRLSNWGSSLSRRQTETGDNGNFEIRAIPVGHNYNIYASAEGYGQKDVEAHADNAVDNRLNIETLTLPVANLSVSGQIVDTQGNPVPHARVEGSGEDQPYPRTLSDTQGNFTLDGLCAGLVYIRADVSRSGKRLSARVHTDAGATSIKIIVREGRPVSYYIGAKSYEQVIQSSEKVIAGMVIDENGSPVAGVPVGVSCIKRQREKGKFSWSYSNYSVLSDITDEQGRFAIELEEDAEYNLRFSPDNHAAVIIYDVPIGKKDLKVTLPKGGTVTGRLVRMEKGEQVPIPNVEVKIEQIDRASYTHLGFDRDRTTITDSQGRFRFEHLRTKIRPGGSRSEKQWDHVARVWEISYGDTSKTIAFYDGTMIEDFELVVRPDLAHMPSLLGIALPGFDSIKIDIAADYAKDRMMFVCFFDINQRPSRHCLRQLAGRFEQLKRKGVIAVAVQASKVDENMISEWVKKFDVQFPVGLIKTDIEKMRFTWGVQALPWLMLTDSKHIVRAEGFNLADLDEKLKQISGD
jgi:protocatechuate 3,4-dioxygenase beta subunit